MVFVFQRQQAAFEHLAVGAFARHKNRPVLATFLQQLDLIHAQFALHFVGVVALHATLFQNRLHYLLIHHGLIDVFYWFYFGNTFLRRQPQQAPKWLGSGLREVVFAVRERAALVASQHRKHRRHDQRGRVQQTAERNFIGKQIGLGHPRHPGRYCHPDALPFVFFEEFGLVAAAQRQQVARRARKRSPDGRPKQNKRNRRAFYLHFARKSPEFEQARQEQKTNGQMHQNGVKTANKSSPIGGLK